MPVTIARNSTLSSQDALNAMAFGIAGLRSTDIAITDIKGTTLALSNTDAAKAIPSGVRGMVFWTASLAFRYRFDTAADASDGGYADANDKQIATFDPAGQTSPATLHAILASSTDTLFINWLYGN